jgi:hypothetical protein
MDGIMGGAGLAGWNGAQAYCQEISEIRRACHNARLSDNIEAWYKLLVAYYLALSARMEVRTRDPKTGKETIIDKRKTRFVAMQDEQDKQFREAGDAINRYKKAVASKQNSIPTTDYLVLLLWERSLRRDENKLGLLMRDADDPTAAFDAGTF